MTAHPGRTLAIACLIGGSAGWAMTAAGAGAGTLAPAYRADLTTLGLMTTALVLPYAIFQLPSGSFVDRVGPRKASILGLSLVVVVHLIASLAPETWLAMLCRALAGAGYAVCFVSGAELVRSRGGGPSGIGIFGGAALATSGAAVLTVPLVEQWLGWRSAWVTSGIVAAVALLAATRLKVPRLDSPPAEPDDPPSEVSTPHRPSLLRDGELHRLGTIHAVTLGLGVVLSNWVTIVLADSWGFEQGTAAFTGSLLLGISILSRPLGGALSRRLPGRMGQISALSLAACALGTLALSIVTAPVIAGAGVLAIAVMSGLPFAAVISAAQAHRPDRPAAAVGLLNGQGCLLIVVGTPMLGSAIQSGWSSLALQVVAVFWLLPLLARPRTIDLGTGPRPKASATPVGGETTSE